MGVPADCVYGADNVEASRLPAGFRFYGAYYNGPYANVGQVHARFPSADIISIAVHLSGSTGARAADAEPGTFSQTESGNFAGVEQFLKTYTGSTKPIVYTMASWARDLELYLDSVGIARSRYFLWTAHYNGLHLCGPSAQGGCGFGASLADGTQYATGYNDYNVFRGYVIDAPATAPKPSNGSITLGDTGSRVTAVQIRLNVWAKVCGYAVLITDGDFGGKTYNAVRLFQAKNKLAVDGIVGSSTNAALNKNPGVVVKILPKPKTPAPVVPSGNPEIKLGDSGKQVAAMQYYLRNSGLLGVRGIDADGDFGQQTLTSLKNFQRLKGLVQDGVYGPATAKALAKIAVG